MKYSCLIFLGLSVLLFSCSESPYYTKSHEFSNQIWNLNEKPRFIVDIKDTNQRYDFTFYIRTTSDYAYNNIWVFLHSTDPSGEKSKEAFEVKTTNKDGSWIGKKSGSVIEHKFDKIKSVKFSKKGKYTFSLEQASDKGDLKNVIDATLVVEKSKK